MATKYLKLNDTTGFAEEATPITTSAGAANADSIVKTGSNGYLDTTLLPPGTGADAVTATAGEAISAGALVYFDSTGKIYNADATSVAKFAVAFVLTAIASGATGTAYFIGQNTALSGLTVGASYFLSATQVGGITSTPPTTAGNISQFVGKAIAANTLNFNPLQPVKRA